MTDASSISLSLRSTPPSGTMQRALGLLVLLAAAAAVQGAALPCRCRRSPCSHALILLLLLVQSAISQPSLV